MKIIIFLFILLILSGCQNPTQLSSNSTGTSVNQSSQVDALRQQLEEQQKTITDLQKQQKKADAYIKAQQNLERQKAMEQLKPADPDWEGLDKPIDQATGRLPR